MSFTIILKPAETISAKTVTIDKVVIVAVRDLFKQKRIIARIEGLPQGLILWDGETEYNAAGDWTNETVLAQAQAILASENPRFI
jgi:predicted ATP-grasp superfamily ATP-dependent carboligase